MNRESLSIQFIRWLHDLAKISSVINLRKHYLFLHSRLGILSITFHSLALQRHVRVLDVRNGAVTIPLNDTQNFVSYANRDVLTAAERLSI